jgi:hypothetical protein
MFYRACVGISKLSFRFIIWLVELVWEEGFKGVESDPFVLDVDHLVGAE